METKIALIITKYWVEDAFPVEILPALKELNIAYEIYVVEDCCGAPRRRPRLPRAPAIRSSDSEPNVLLSATQGQLITTGEDHDAPFISGETEDHAPRGDHRAITPPVSPSSLRPSIARSADSLSLSALR